MILFVAGVFVGFLLGFISGGLLMKSKLQDAREHPRH